MSDTYYRDRAHEAQDQVWAACRALGALEVAIKLYDGTDDGTEDFAAYDRVGDGKYLADRVREHVAALEAALIKPQPDA